jgi:hypothetical protein
MRQTFDVKRVHAVKQVDPVTVEVDFETRGASIIRMRLNNYEARELMGGLFLITGPTKV